MYYNRWSGHPDVTLNYYNIIGYIPYEKTKDFSVIFVLYSA